MTERVSHVAYADESRHNIGRYRSVALLTLKECHDARMTAELRARLVESGVTEFKWKDLGSAKARLAAIKLVDYVLDQVLRGELRVDVLIWDIEDTRHKIHGRDDEKNLSHLYYRIFENVLRIRWPDNAVWRLYPDEHSGIDWGRIRTFLGLVGSRVEGKASLLDSDDFYLKRIQEFSISEIISSDSKACPLIQVADLLAGLAVYSRTSYPTYTVWLDRQMKQDPLPMLTTRAETTLSNTDEERCKVLSGFDEKCKRHKLRVSLKTHQGLQTMDPSKPINFWLYIPRHEFDKAPTKTASWPM